MVPSEKRTHQAARFVKRILVAIGALGMAFVATTWWALESGGVAVIETLTSEQQIRSTHVWYVESDGEVWLEAGSPENAWFRDLRTSSTVTFEADGSVSRYSAQPVDDPSAQGRVRALIREKYALRDLWVGLLIDASRSVPVRLLPQDG